MAGKEPGGDRCVFFSVAVISEFQSKFGSFQVPRSGKSAILSYTAVYPSPGRRPHVGPGSHGGTEVAGGRAWDLRSGGVPRGRRRVLTYDEVFTNQIDGFVDRLLEMIPSLEEHRCSEGVKGGLIVRLREGTLLGHVIEHIALELQYIAYMDVGFGKTIDTDRSGVFNVIFSYWVEKAGLFAGVEAVKIVNAILAGKSYDLEAAIYELKGIRDDFYLGHPGGHHLQHQPDRCGDRRQQAADQIHAGRCRYSGSPRHGHPEGEKRPGRRTVAGLPGRGQAP